MIGQNIGLCNSQEVLSDLLMPAPPPRGQEGFQQDLTDQRVMELDGSLWQGMQHRLRQTFHTPARAFLLKPGRQLTRDSGAPPAR